MNLGFKRVSDILCILSRKKRVVRPAGRAAPLSIVTDAASRYAKPAGDLISGVTGVVT
jgi:hypothetical protein